MTIEDDATWYRKHIDQMTVSVLAKIGRKGVSVLDEQYQEIFNALHSFMWGAVHYFNTKDPEFEAVTFPSMTEQQIADGLANSQITDPDFEVRCSALKGER